MKIDMTFERREELFRKEEREIGRSEGIDLEKTELVQKKIAKGKTLDVIADEMESTIEEIKPIFDAVMKDLKDGTPAGSLNKYADVSKIPMENETFANAMVKKHS